MHKNILITGSHGFIGTHLKGELKQSTSIQIFEHTRSDTFENLAKHIEKIDFIYHLAGEVNPKSDQNSFVLGNIETTQNLIDLLEQKDLKIPILLASSIHAKNPKNDYGTTKQKSEELILAYGNRNNTPVYIYRLPHLFGQNCKPNYNSVISTWIYNSINDLELKVFDRNIIIHYSYVKDIVKEFTQHLNDKATNKQRYLEPRIIYETSLGEVVDFIEEFKYNMRNAKYEVINNKFKAKLFTTYQDYYQTTRLKD